MKKNIAFLLPSLALGGQEKIASNLSFSLSSFYNINFFLFQNKIALPYKGRLIHFNTSPKSNFFGKIYNSIKRTYSLNTLIKQYRIKTVISFGETANLVNLLTSKEAKTIITILTGLNNINFYTKIYKFSYKLLYRKANIIVANSKAIKFFLENLGINSNIIKVIYTPIEYNEIKEKSKEDLGTYEFLKEFPYLINVGRLTEAKGQWYLLRIFRELKRKQKELKLILLGEGELKNYLVELSENLGLETYVWNRDKLHEGYDVYFLGFQKNPYKFVKHAKAFVFTSLWEGFPNVVAESLAVGKAVISTDCRTGPREILAPDTDFLKETREPEFAKYGILMPTFERRKLKANEKLTREEKVWIETLEGLLEEEKILEDYEKKAPQRAFDFHIDKIAKQWMEVIEK